MGVEPNPSVQKQLLQNVADLGVRSSQLVGVALCEDDSGDAGLYMYSDQLFEDMPDVDRAINGNAGLSREDLVWTHHYQYAEVSHLFTPSRWQRMVEYIIEVPVKCSTPESLLEEIGIV